MLSQNTERYVTNGGQHDQKMEDARTGAQIEDMYRPRGMPKMKKN